MLVEKEERFGLWHLMVINQMRADGYDFDKLEMFIRENYKKWKLIESNIDSFLDEILEGIEVWSPWYEGCSWDDCEEEINKRLGRF
ncbi:MAG: hypothetical protein ACI85I_002928 [Arenicella sp.]